MKNKCKFLSIKIKEMNFSQHTSYAEVSECSLKKSSNFRTRIAIKESYNQITNKVSPLNFECSFFSNEETKCGQCVCFEAQ